MPIARDSLRRTKVVVLRPLGLGDFLAGVPAYRGIRRHFPTAQILLACPAYLRDLAALTDLFDGVVATQPLTTLSDELADADVAIDLHGRGPESMRILLAARPRRLVAFRESSIPRTANMATWRAGEHEVWRWCRMLEHAGIACDRGDLTLPVPCGTPIFGPSATIVHPGAASVARRWPEERWAAVARAEQAAGHAIVLTGSLQERDITARIATAANIPETHNVAGRTSLLELASLVSTAGRVISGDTGIAHLAFAYQRPSVTLFGPTSPEAWGPPNSQYHQVLWVGRLGDPHGTTLDPGLAQITVANVLTALDRLADAAPTPPERLRSKH